MTVPIIHLTANDKTLSASTMARLLSLRISDEAGLKNDRLELSFDDNEGKLERPKVQDSLSVWLEPPGGKSHFMGRFFVDSYSLAGTPRTLSVSASSASVISNYKSFRTKTLHGVSVSDVVTRIADFHELKPKISAEFDSVVLDQVVQLNESDMTLLTRLAERYGATTKVADGHLLFLTRADMRSPSGVDLEPWSLGLSDLIRWQMSYSERDAFKSAVASWRDVENAEDKTVRVGEGTPEYRLRFTFANEEEARVAAEAELRRRSRGKSELSLTLPGNARLRAEGNLLLEDVRDGVDGNWAVTSVTHSVGDDGFVSSLKAERPNSSPEAAIWT